MIDQWLFDWLLTRQNLAGHQGGLLELGVFQGKSAIVLGRHLRPGQRFTVCDLFESPAQTAANAGEMERWYPELTRSVFEANYLAFHDSLPQVVQGPSGSIRDHLAPGSCRFVHIDASHLYDHVSEDLRSAATLLGPDGVVVLDDYRAEHAPGVGAAIWEAVFTRGLRPILLTGQKLYATWGDPAPVQHDLGAWLRERPECVAEHQSIAGADVIRVSHRPRILL
ncbi:class I SAM-dependent methyltransferase [Nonomuraea sp. NBC_01738]|uniref:class I SAM-dependent methyltransferase n=1 Tax=Nonomuraea sp. NBC_01738 TaxID=2976003 RepID=UPI002E15CD1A|nr:class I SAM-dependent methyltransferase [Nonomuraea sp. NBC_01738]